MSNLKPCDAVSPTGGICTMAKGHFGPHKVGGPYAVTEVFIIRCTEKPCEFHYDGVEDQCIWCGTTQPAEGEEE